GTGAAPVIARFAKDMGILTVGIVTIPFVFEGERKIIQALNGVEEISKNVDALLVINNERLREIYPDLTMPNAFGKADDTLTTAAKSIAEIITLPGIINLDFADVNTTMKDGGVALMSNGFGEGEGRVRLAIEDALNSPLLNNNDIFNAKKILFNVSFGPDSELRMEEMNDVHDFMSRFGRDIEVIWGTAMDDTLGSKVKMTILATGFGMEDIPQIADKRRAESARMTEEELRLEEERLKKEQDEKFLIDKYYGASGHRMRRVAARSKAVVLNLDELDDDALIALIEDNPTYNRDPKIIARVRAKTGSEEETPAAASAAMPYASTNTPKSSTTQPNKAGTGGKPTISFR
ncbi:MAG: cell division protein FtsZ, partial [Tannerellaceae bacterium]